MRVLKCELRHACPRESDGRKFWESQVGSTPLRRSLPRAQGDGRIEYHPTQAPAEERRRMARLSRRATIPRSEGTLEFPVDR